MKKFDLVFNPIITEKPKLIISMRNFNHVYLGFYKVFNESSDKDVIKFFWAEHNNKDTFYRCLLSNERLNCWSSDMLEVGISESYEVSNLHKKILTELLQDQYFLNESGFLKQQYNILLKKESNYTFILREESSLQDDLSIAEIEILSVLNKSLSIDSSLKFKINI